MDITKEMLIHWWRWHFDWTVYYTKSELAAFENIIKKYGVDKVLQMGVTSYILFDGSPRIILIAIRNNSVEELFNSLPNIYLSCTYHEIKEYNKMKKDFVKHLIMRYNLDNKN